MSTADIGSQHNTYFIDQQRPPLYKQIKDFNYYNKLNLDCLNY